jgi:glycosyltransferase involved in cell wall biosynthesis
MATHYFASHEGGIELVAGRLFRELSSLRQEIVWIAGDVTPPPAADGSSRTAGLRVFNWVEKKIGLPFPIPTPGALRKVWDEVRHADVLIIHDCLYLTNIAAYAAARLAKVPVIVVQHIGFVPYSSRFLRTVMTLANRVATRPMLRGAQQVVFISETTRRHFETVRFRTTPALVFNGVDAAVFRPMAGAAAKADLRERFGLPADRPIVLFVGRFVEKKGVAALKRMAELQPGYTWAFAGWGPMDPRESNCANVRVFSDLRGDRLADLYRASDLFVLPSTGEGFPLVVQEALACGLPVICGAETASADPAVACLVRGIELHPGDDESTARRFLSAIAEALTAEPQASLAQQRRDFVLSRYSWRLGAERYLSIAAQLVPEDRRPHLAELMSDPNAHDRKQLAREASA